MQRNAKEASRVSLGATVGLSWPWAQECSPLLGTNASFRFQSSLALKFWICNGVSREPKVCLTSMAHRIVKKKKKATFFQRLWNLWLLSYSCVFHSTPGLLHLLFRPWSFLGEKWQRSQITARSMLQFSAGSVAGGGGDGGWLLHPQATAEVSPIAQRPYRSQISSLCSK